MANNGGTVVPTLNKLIVISFTGTATEIQTALRAELTANDIIVDTTFSRRKDSNDFMLGVVYLEQ
tara:strand:- start:2661 stop:2855 length:195 start_codon:yes stop_codon:yes gene_type:complete